LKFGSRSLYIVLCLSLGACERAPQQVKTLQYSNAPVGPVVQTYRLAIPPLYSPQQLSVAYQPLVHYLNSRIAGVAIELESSRDFKTYEQKFRERKPEILLLNPWETLQAMKSGYQVIAMAGDVEDFKGIFIVRKDSPVKTPADLKGKVVSYPSPTALAAAIMTQYYLHTDGIDVNHDIHNIYVGSHESSILNAYMGKAAAASTWPPAWRLFQKDHPQEANQLKVIWETPPLINNAVMVRDDVPAAIRLQIKQALPRLGNTAEGQAILAGMETARFHPATDRSYDRIRNYIVRFEKEVRPVEHN
jgi:phosphonate transport system substrate-binding protein